MSGFLTTCLCVLGLVTLAIADYELRKPDPETKFQLVNRATRKCIDVRGISRTNVELWSCEDPCDPKTDQVWSMDKGGRLVNAASGKCMDVLGRGSRQPGMNINLWSCSTSSSDDNVWQLRKDKGGKYAQIYNPKTSLCVDVAGGAMTRNGLNIQQRHCEAADRPRTTHWWYMKEVTCNKATPLNKSSTRGGAFASSNLVSRAAINPETTHRFPRGVPARRYRTSKRPGNSIRRYYARKRGRRYRGRRYRGRRYRGRRYRGRRYRGRRYRGRRYRRRRNRTRRIRGRRYNKTAKRNRARVLASIYRERKRAKILANLARNRTATSPP